MLTTIVVECRLQKNCWCFVVRLFDVFMFRLLEKWKSKKINKE